ncbi:hypothetical protein [Pseudoalteromonas sp. PPB1]|uniref:hypothetical protein n=1 Tax=Pseudoalteromonas sp. PPB1 TaxID=2756136 RepID=UPI001891E39C|nr:hypothetical protein [Pseudoalteromonas sp. PPB1]
MKRQIRESNLKFLSQSQQLNQAQTPNVAGGQIEPNSNYRTYRNCPPPADSMACAPAQEMICVITGPCSDF